MQRTGFKRPERVRVPMAWPGRQNFAQTVQIQTPAPTQFKTAIVRSEAYRRVVAAMPCKKCGIQGYSQAAHLPPDGKGKKQDDRLIFALCSTRPGITGCHVEFDQYRMFPRDVAMTVGLGWALETMQEVIAAGNWPKRLPKWTETGGTT